MAVVTLSPEYIRKLAQSYKLLRAGEPADPKVLVAIKTAAERCVAAHMRTELRLTADVRLPLATVLMMLEYVRQEATAQLEPRPQPEDVAPTPHTQDTKPFFMGVINRLLKAVA
jgi:hypothetical protein